MKYLLALVTMVSMPAFAADLSTSDMTGITFWLVTAAMLAATVFFFAERDVVKGKWKTSLSVAGLVTGVAFWHYLYMRGVWADTGTSPTVYRYIDWLITVPLQIIEFYLILRVCTNVGSGLFWKLLGASLVMLIAGFLEKLDLHQHGQHLLLGWQLGCISYTRYFQVKLENLMPQVVMQPLKVLSAQSD